MAGKLIFSLLKIASILQLVNLSAFSTFIQNFNHSPAVGLMLFLLAINTIGTFIDQLRFTESFCYQPFP